MARKRPDRASLTEGEFADSGGSLTELFGAGGAGRAPAMPINKRIAPADIDPYDNNPRFLPNEAEPGIYDSLKARGLEDTLWVTQRPDAERPMVYAGHNTILRCAQRLQAEGDERFQQIECKFIPWKGELATFGAHLGENTNRGRQAFIEDAHAWVRFAELWQAEHGEQKRPASRKLAGLLKAAGVGDWGHTEISLGFYAVEHLWPVLEQTFGVARAGRTLVEELRRLVNTLHSVAKEFNYEGEPAELDALWQEVFADLDCDEGIDPKEAAETLAKRLGKLIPDQRTAVEDAVVADWAKRARAAAPTPPPETNTGNGFCTDPVQNAAGRQEDVAPPPPAGGGAGTDSGRDPESSDPEPSAAIGSAEGAGDDTRTPPAQPPASDPPSDEGAATAGAGDSAVTRTDDEFCTDPVQNASSRSPGDRIRALRQELATAVGELFGAFGIEGTMQRSERGSGFVLVAPPAATLRDAKGVRHYERACALWQHALALTDQTTYPQLNEGLPDDSPLQSILDPSSEASLDQVIPTHGVQDAGGAFWSWLSDAQWQRWSRAMACYRAIRQLGYEHDIPLTEAEID